MAIGFTVTSIAYWVGLTASRMMMQVRHYMRLLGRLALCLTLFSTQCLWAQDVRVVGLFPPNKALISVEGQNPRAIAVGSSLNGVKVLSVEENGAQLEFGGKRQFVPMGSGFASPSANATNGSGAQSVTLPADARGHFFAQGTINGGHMQFLVDTGASSIAIGTSDARRLGLNLNGAQMIRLNTANGNSVGYLVQLREVNVGGIIVYGIDAVVTDGIQGPALLGMTFLNRMEMKRDGQTMVLTKKY